MKTCTEQTLDYGQPCFLFWDLSMFPGIVKYQAFTLPNQNIRFYNIFLLKNSKVLPVEKVDRYGRFTKRLHKTRIKWKLKLNAEFPLEYIKRQPASSIFFPAMWKSRGLLCGNDASCSRPRPVKMLITLIY